MRSIRRREDHRIRRGLQALAVLAVALVFGASFELLRRVIGITSPWLVLLLMFYFLGLAKVAEPLFKLRMPKVLRPLRPWEPRDHVYRRLRVVEFGRLLRQPPLRFLNSAVYLDGRRSDALQVRLYAESAEATHFCAAVLLLPYIALAGLSGRGRGISLFSPGQALVQVY